MLQMLGSINSVDLQKIFFSIYGYVRLLFCLVHNLYCIPAYVLLNFLLYPLYCVSMGYYSNIENYLYNWLLYIVSSWSYGAGLVVHEHGDDIYRLRKDPNVRLLVIANHQSTADVPLMMQAFTSRSKYVLLWVMDSVFKWTHFGLVSQVHGDYFLNTKKYINGDLFNHCTNNYSRLKNLIVLFPEGGFRYKRIDSSNSFASKRKFPKMTNVSYPRVNGFRELLEPNVGVTHVVDLTICYDDAENVPSALDILLGRPVCQVHFHYRVHSVGDTKDIRSENWIYEQWQRKEALLTNHYQTMRELKRKDNSINKSNSPDINTTNLSNSNNNNDYFHSTKGDIPPELEPLTKGSVLSLSTTSSSSSSSSSSSLNVTVKDLEINGNAIVNETKIDEEKVLEQTTEHITKTNKLLPAGDEELMLEASNELKFKSYHHFMSTDKFNPSAGTPVTLNWFKVILIHMFYLSINIIVYQSIVHLF